jgi:hypothetical protein
VAEQGTGAEQVVIRPHKARWVGWIAALLLVGVLSAVGVLLRTVSTGVYFHTSDQVAMVVLGLLMGAGVLVPAYSRVRADAEGIEVRNLLITRRVEWTDVVGLGFPHGARWARLDLPYDEYLPLSAIQLVDGQRAVEAMDRLRGLHARAQGVSHSG